MYVGGVCCTTGGMFIKRRVRFLYTLARASFKNLVTYQLVSQIVIASSVRSTAEGLYRLSSDSRSEILVCIAAIVAFARAND